MALNKCLLSNASMYIPKHTVHLTVQRFAFNDTLALRNNLMNYFKIIFSSVG